MYKLIKIIEGGSGPQLFQTDSVLALPTKNGAKLLDLTNPRTESFVAQMDTQLLRVQSFDGTLFLGGNATFMVKDGQTQTYPVYILHKLGSHHFFTNHTVNWTTNYATFNLMEYPHRMIRTIEEGCCYAISNDKQAFYTVQDKDYQRQDIVSIELKTGQELWRHSVADLPLTYDNQRQLDVPVQTGRLSYADERHVWVGLSSLQFLVLDAKTGERIKLFGEPLTRSNIFLPDGRLRPDSVQSIPGFGYQDLSNRQLLYLGLQGLWTFNLDTFAITYTDLTEEFRKANVQSLGTIVFDTDYIYFFDKQPFGSNPICKVAALDRHSLRVVWQHDFWPNSMPMDIKLAGRYLFVLDSTGTLHIFERES